MKNKKIIIVSSVIILLIAIVVAIILIAKPFNKKNENNQNQEENNISKEQIYNVTYDMDVAEDLSNKDALNDIAEYIAIIKVKSIDKVSNLNEKTGDYTFAYTEGKADVINVLKGTIEDKQIVFTRAGGKMKWNDWISNRLDKEKYEAIAKEKNLDTDNTIVSEKPVGDIDIEEDKTYLVFMKKNEQDKYLIGALQYGTREVQDEIISTMSINDIKKLKVRDNVKNTWVNITDVVNFDKLK